MTDEQQTDNEANELLAQMNEQQTEREQLENRAKELGVSFRGNTGNDKLRERIAEAEAAILSDCDNVAIMTAPASPSDDSFTDDSFTVECIANNPQNVGGKILRKGESCTLNVHQLGNAKLMKRVDHAIKLELLKRV